MTCAQNWQLRWGGSSNQKITVIFDNRNLSVSGPTGKFSIPYQIIDGKIVVEKEDGSMQTFGRLSVSDSGAVMALNIRGKEVYLRKATEADIQREVAEAERRRQQEEKSVQRERELQAAAELERQEKARLEAETARAEQAKRQEDARKAALEAKLALAKAEKERQAAEKARLEAEAEKAAREKDEKEAALAAQAKAAAEQEAFKQARLREIAKTVFDSGKLYKDYCTLGKKGFLKLYPEGTELKVSGRVRMLNLGFALEHAPHPNDKEQWALGRRRFLCLSDDVPGSAGLKTGDMVEVNGTVTPEVSQGVLQLTIDASKIRKLR